MKNYSILLLALIISCIFSNSQAVAVSITEGYGGQLIGSGTYNDTWCQKNLNNAYCSASRCLNPSAGYIPIVYHYENGDCCCLVSLYDATYSYSVSLSEETIREHGTVTCPAGMSVDSSGCCCMFNDMTPRI